MYLAKRLAAAVVFFVVELGAVMVVAVAVAMTRVVAGHATGIGFVRPDWGTMLTLTFLLAPLAWTATWLSRRAVPARSRSSALL